MEWDVYSMQFLRKQSRMNHVRELQLKGQVGGDITPYSQQVHMYFLFTKSPSEVRGWVMGNVLG